MQGSDSIPNPDVSPSWRRSSLPDSVLEAAAEVRAGSICVHLPGARELVYHAAP